MRFSFLDEADDGHLHTRHILLHIPLPFSSQVVICDGCSTMQLLRVNSNNELVVPPFECAWLSDKSQQLNDDVGCIAFEVKGVRH